MKVRIASAMNEVERLQREIDSAIERQSLYAASSRPSTAHSMAPTEMEPMPSIPALPPAAPSFSERLSQERPRTAPSQLPVRIPRRAKTFAEASAAFITPPPSREGPEHQPPPPLPLVLRPPLRKKKSFSRVSSWLFPGGAAAAEHSRDMSFDPVTNLPRPVKGREGFYQCVSPPEGAGGRRSFDSTAAVSMWTSEDEDQTAPTTTWSPGSTPLTKQHEEVPLERVSTFGKERGAKTLRRPSESTAIASLSTLSHHGIIYVPLGYAKTFGQLSNLEEIHGGSPWGAGTFAGADGSRQPTKLELEIATLQGEQFYLTASKHFS
ncbi:Protoplast secreted protein 2 like [Verticillium longisporum]|nr:Protoplast secreted protein 2 like [Verticillium longisporum]